MELINYEVYSRIQNAIQTYENYSVYLKEVGMELTALSCKSKTKMMRNVGTRILVIGSLNCGKSTVINALAGESVVQTGICKGTAIINHIKAGSDPNTVKIYCNNHSEPEYLSKESFDMKYNRDIELTARIIRGDICAQQHQEIKYSEISCNSDFFAGGIQLVDTPCLEDKLNTRIVEQEYLPEADVIVVVLNGTSFFTRSEYKFIQKHFSNKHLKNLFILVNHADYLAADNAWGVAVKHYRDKLHDVFIDEHGDFDEKLYNSRVFFTDAYASFGIRTGIRKDDCWTGIPEFEVALSGYLNSEAYITGKLEALLRNMARTYSVVEKRYTEKLQLLQKAPIEVHECVYDALRSIHQQSHSVDKTESEIRKIGKMVEHEILDSWRYFAKEELPHRIHHQQSLVHATAIPLSPPVSRELMKEINLFFSDSLHSWKTSVKQMVSGEVMQIGVRIENTGFTINNELDQFVDDALGIIKQYWENTPVLFGFQLQGHSNNLVLGLNDALAQIEVPDILDSIQMKIENEKNKWYKKRLIALQEEKKDYENFLEEYYRARHPQEVLLQEDRVLTALFDCFKHVYWECYGTEPTMKDLQKLV